MATLLITPPSRSANVTVCSAVQVATASGANAVTSHDTEPASALGSDTTRLVMVTLPVLVTVMS